MSYFKKENTFKDRGKDAENAVQKFLKEWAEQCTTREFNRLPDTKAAGRIMKAAAADFEFFYLAEMDDPVRFHGLLEVKETEHEYRLARDKISQLPRLRKRANCGGVCLAIVHHSTLKKWRVISARDLAETGDKGSWNLTGLPLYDTPGAALQGLYPSIFGAPA